MADFYATSTANSTTTALGAGTAPGNTFRGSSQVQGDTVTSLALPRPVGLAVDDVMLAAISTVSPGRSVPAPSGWTQVREDGTTGATPGVNQQVFWKRAVSADTTATSFTFSWTGASDATGVLVAYSGIKSSGDPVQANAGSSLTVLALNALVVAPSVTTVDENTMVVWFIAANTDSRTVGTLGTEEERVDVAGTLLVTSGGAAFDERSRASGSTGSRNFRLEPVVVLDTPVAVATIALSMTPASVFTGTSEDVKDYNTIRVWALADQDSAPGGLQFLWSSDNVTFKSLDRFALAANEPLALTFAPQSRHMKVRYENGPVAQGSFALQIAFLVPGDGPTPQRTRDRCIQAGPVFVPGDFQEHEILRLSPSQHSRAIEIRGYGANVGVTATLPDFKYRVILRVGGQKVHGFTVRSTSAAPPWLPVVHTTDGEAIALSVLYDVSGPSQFFDGVLEVRER